MAFEHPFYFLRHGETVWNNQGRTQGQLDSRLNDRGHRQADAAGEALAGEPIERIVSSPLIRVRDTAAAVARRHDVPVTYDRGLMECHLGIHQGLPHGQFLPAYFRGEYDPPGGETFQVFSDRVWAAMARAVALGPNTLIVAHGGLWIAAQRFVAVDPNLPRMPNALPLHITPSKDRWQHRILGGIEPTAVKGF